MIVNSRNTNQNFIMFKYLLSTLVLVFALSSAMAQDTGSTSSDKETTTISKDADVSSQTPASTKEHKCEPGCKKACCSKAEAKACKPGCEKKCTGKHEKKAEAKHACAPGCTKACCAPEEKK